MNCAKPSNASSTGRCQRATTRAPSRVTSPRRSPYASSLKSIGAVDLRGITDAIRSIPSIVWWGVVFIALLFACTAAFRSALDQPTVYSSYETRECLRAESADGKPMSCAEATRDRYHNVWVP